MLSTFCPCSSEVTFWIGAAAGDQCYCNILFVNTPGLCVVTPSLLECRWKGNAECRIFYMTTSVCVSSDTPLPPPPPPHLWPVHSSSSLPAVHLTSCSALSRPCLWTHQACFPVVTQEERYWLRGEGVRFPPRVCRLLYLSHGEQLQQQF